jgi:hypothetical protein
VSLVEEDFCAGALGPFADFESRLSDRDIRQALLAPDSPLSRSQRTLALEEVRCWRGHVRADYVLVSNDALAVVEVKSDCDSLRRFGEQARVYSAIADRVILVVGWALAANALRAAPRWWEVWLAEKPPVRETRLVPLRDGAPNPALDPSGLVAMLPRAEIRRLAQVAGIRATVSDQRELRRELVAHLSCSDLRLAVHDWLVRLSDGRGFNSSSISSANASARREAMRTAVE